MEYQRIVSLAPSVTETIFALKQEHRLVGVTNYCDFPAEARKKASIGGFASPDVEQILNLNPDLILVTGLHLPERLQVFQQQGITVKAVQADKLTDSPEAIRKIGEYLGVEDAANKLADEILYGFETLEKQTALFPRVRVCYFCSFDPVCGWKNKCQVNELIRMLGGEPICVDKDRMQESIRDAHPDLILIPDTTSGKPQAELQHFVETDPILSQTEAYRNGQVGVVNGNLLSRPGPRAVIGLRLLAEAIHPEIKTTNQE